MRVCNDYRATLCPGGSGTGLAGGATPAGDVPPVIVVTTKMDRILDVDAEQRVAWVEPGVLNLDLSRAVAPLGLHFAPDRPASSRVRWGATWPTTRAARTASCTASRRPLLAVEVVLPDGRV